MPVLWQNLFFAGGFLGQNVGHAYSVQCTPMSCAIINLLKTTIHIYLLMMGKNCARILTKTYHQLVTHK